MNITHVPVHSYVWHYSFINTTRPIHMYDLIYSLCMRSCRSIPVCQCIHTCELTHSYMWHDSFVHMTWIIRCADSFMSIPVFQWGKDQRAENTCQNFSKVSCTCSSHTKLGSVLTFENVYQNKLHIENFSNCQRATQISMRTTYKAKFWDNLPEQIAMRQCAVIRLVDFVHIYMYRHKHIHIYLYLYLFRYLHLHLCTFVNVKCICLYICVYTYVYTYIPEQITLRQGAVVGLVDLHKHIMRTAEHELHLVL